MNGLGTIAQKDAKDLEEDDEDAIDPEDLQPEREEPKKKPAAGGSTEVI